MEIHHQRRREREVMDNLIFQWKHQSAHTSWCHSGQCCLVRFPEPDPHESIQIRRRGPAEGEDCAVHGSGRKAEPVSKAPAIVVRPDRLNGRNHQPSIRTIAATARKDRLSEIESWPADASTGQKERQDALGINT